MAFRVGNTTAEGYRRAKADAANLKARVDAYITDMAAGNASGAQVVEIGVDMAANHTQLTAYKNIPGIGDYAKSVEDDAAYNVGAEFDAMLAALAGVCTEVYNTIPKNGTDQLTIYTIDTACNVTVQSFTPVQTASLRAKLQIVSDAIAWV